MVVSFILIMCGVGIFAAAITYATESGYWLHLLFAIPVAIFLIGFSILRAPNYTNQERCERSRFTWQLTDELVKSGDNYVYRGYCVDL